MENKKIFEVLGMVAAAILVFAVVFNVFSSVFSKGKLGAVTIGYLSSGSSQLTFNSFSAIVDSLTNVRAPLAGVQSTSSVAVLPTFGGGAADGSSATSSVATSSTGFTGAAGDLCIVTVASGTTQKAQTGETITCDVQSNSNIIVSFLVPRGVATSTAQVTYGLNFKVIPAASFVAPAAITVATSSSAN